MENEAIAVRVPTRLYLDLAYQLRKIGDFRSPDDVAALAIKNWLASRTGRISGLGYQWKDVFLPDGTNLRMRYRGAWHYATIEGDRLVYAGESVSPRDWGLMVTGTVRNAWRDIWIRRSIGDAWSKASTCRAKPAECGPLPGVDRRHLTRRATD